MNLKLNRNLITSSCVELEKRRIEYDHFVMVSSSRRSIEMIDRWIQDRDLDFSRLNLKLNRSKLDREPGSDLADPVL